MKYIREKEYPYKYWVRKTIVSGIGLISALAMFVAGWGTSYTNYIPLQENFHYKWLAIGMSIIITLVFGFSSFVENCPKVYRFINLLIVITSSYLAISTVSINTIRDHEARIAADPESQRLYARYESLDSQYNKTMLNYELAFNDGKFKGAQSYREQGEDLKRQAKVAFQEWKNRNNELKEMGSVATEASVTAIAAILPIKPKTIQIMSKVILSIINDMSFKFFAFMVSIIFPRYVMIRLPNTKRSKLAVFKQWCVSFISGHRKFEITSKKVDLHTQAIIDVFKENRQLTYPRIGEIAAARVHRSSPFTKGYICKVLKPLKELK